MARTVAGATPGRTNRKFLIVALLFGAVTAALFYAVTARGGSSTSSTKVAAGDVQVVVAKAPIKQRTLITADMLQLKSISASAVAAGAFTDLNEAVGKVTKFPIEANEQVIASSVVDVSRPVANAALAQVVPTGKRAMSVQASQVFSAGGLVLPGDYVDLIWTCCDRPVVSKTLLRNVQVLAVAQNIVSSGPVNSSGGSSAAGASGSSSSNPVAADPSQPVPDAVTVTLLLSPEDAQLLFLAEQTGKLRMDLRGLGDQDLPDSGITMFPQIIPPDVFKSLPDALRPDFAR